MTTKSLTDGDLQEFTGSENWYQHSIVRDVLFTDGAKYVADQAGAYWLLDEIALAQRYQPSVKAEEFQLWKLMVHDDSSADLLCEDGNGHRIFGKVIAFTDFPLRVVSFYFCNNVILLPSEY